MRTLLKIGLLLFLAGCQVVEDGELGVSKSFGEIKDTPLAPGPYINLPYAREIEVWDVKSQRVSRKSTVPTQEGALIELEVTLNFRVKDVVGVRKELGRDFYRRVVQPQLDNAVREVVGQFRVEQLFRNQTKLSSMIISRLEQGLEKIEAEKPRLAETWLPVEDLTITGLILPDLIKQSIERKLESEQRAKQKEFELQQAKKDAEIEKERAKGLAEAQKIVSETLSARYLQYRWIETLNDNPNVIYVATEANMPMFRSVPSGKP